MEASSSCSSPYFPKTVEEIFRDYSGRRAGLIRALTQDVDSFYQRCNPDDDNLCLYGHPNGTWELSLPVENVPSKIPEPCVGINFARQGGMNRRDWISIVALHSDSWLMSVAFFQGACVGLSQSDRRRLFSMINDLPNVFEVVRDWKEPAKDKPKKDYSCEASGSKTRSSGKRLSDGLRKQLKMVEASDGRGKRLKMVGASGRPGKQLKLVEASNWRGKQKMVDESDNRGKQKMVEESDVKNEEDDDEEETPCGRCNGVYIPSEFWIGCDVCELWYHGRCVRVTQTMADSIEKYECPSCYEKRHKP